MLNWYLEVNEAVRKRWRKRLRVHTHTHTREMHLRLLRFFCCDEDLWKPAERDCNSFDCLDYWWGGPALKHHLFSLCSKKQNKTKTKLSCDIIKLFISLYIQSASSVRWFTTRGGFSYGRVLTRKKTNVEINVDVWSRSCDRLMCRWRGESILKSQTLLIFQLTDTVKFCGWGLWRGCYVEGCSDGRRAARIAVSRPPDWIRWTRRVDFILHILTFFS